MELLLGRDVMGHVNIVGCDGKIVCKVGYELKNTIKVKVCREDVRKK